MKATHSERLSEGRRLREMFPFNCHGEWKPLADRPNPISLLHTYNKEKVKRLLPIKYGRMLESPSAFYRGSAVLMAADLAGTPATGIDVVLCGDANLSNFGLFTTPENRMVFDVKNFDDVYPGPWEWDLKRLATSVVIAGRENGCSEGKCHRLAAMVVKAYSKAMDYLANMSTLERWYYQVDVEQLLSIFECSSKKNGKRVGKTTRKIHLCTYEQSLKRLTKIDDGCRHIISEPPLLVSLHDDILEKIVGETERENMSHQIVEQLWAEYVSSLPDERRYLLQRYEIGDVAFQIGDINCVGARCLIVLLQGNTEDDFILLQLKDAGSSALAPYLVSYHYDNQAQRVVTGQGLMQAADDIFLGWCYGENAQREFYWKQFRDVKELANTAKLNLDDLESYLEVCAWCLARIHARTGDEVKMRGYLGRKGALADAMADFSIAYADQVEQDYQELIDAVKFGQIEAEVGV